MFFFPPIMNFVFSDSIPTGVFPRLVPISKKPVRHEKRGGEQHAESKSRFTVLFEKCKSGIFNRTHHKNPRHTAAAKTGSQKTPVDFSFLKIFKGIFKTSENISLEKENAYFIVQKGLSEIASYFRDKVGADAFDDCKQNLENIQSFESLKAVCDYYAKHKAEWKGPVYISGKDHYWPASMIGNNGKYFVVLDQMVINESETKTIYFGIDLQTGGRVAISLLKKDKCDQVSEAHFEATRLTRENFYKLQKLGKANENHVLPLYELIDIQEKNKKGISQQFLVQNLCSGLDLVDYINDGDLTQIEKRELGRQFFRPVMALHCANLLHKDLRPENYFIADGQLLLADFDYTSKKDEKGTVGTYCYLPPETILNKTYDESAEVWAMGAILYHHISGKRPYIVEQLYELSEIFNISNPPPETLFNLLLPWGHPEVEQEVEKSKILQLLKKMLCVKHEERIGLHDAYEEFENIPAAELDFNAEFLDRRIQEVSDPYIEQIV